MEAAILLLNHEAKIEKMSVKLLIMTECWSWSGLLLETQV